MNESGISSLNLVIDCHFPTYYCSNYQTFHMGTGRFSIMEPSTGPQEEWETTQRAWMVEYTVQVGEEMHRHLSMIMAGDVSDVHHMLLKELRKEYQSSERVDVTVHRIEPISTNTDALYFEGMYAP